MPSEWALRGPLSLTHTFSPKLSNAFSPRSVVQGTQRFLLDVCLCLNCRMYANVNLYIYVCRGKTFFFIRTFWIVQWNFIYILVPVRMILPEVL